MGANQGQEEVGIFLSQHVMRGLRDGGDRMGLGLRSSQCAGLAIGLVDRGDGVERVVDRQMHKWHRAVGLQRLEPVDFKRLGVAKLVPVDKHLRIAECGIGDQAFGRGIVDAPGLAAVATVASAVALHRASAAMPCRAHGRRGMFVSVLQQVIGSPD
jgi:hypothetical protein